MLLSPSLALENPIKGNLLLTPMLISAEGRGERSRGADWFMTGEEAKIFLPNIPLVT